MQRRTGAKALRQLVAVFAAGAPLIAMPQQVRAEPATACSKLYPAGTVRFAGLNPAIERREPMSRFAPDQIVEIDTVTMTEQAAREHIAELHRLPARVSIYLPGGHCNIANKDCEELEKAGVKVAPTTGSWNWDKDEKRVLNVEHPAMIARNLKKADHAWRLGANYIRVDNLHHPAGSIEPRTAPQMQAVMRPLHELEDRLRAEGAIPRWRATGLVAHNNLEVWEELIRKGLLKRPPVLLTSERTAQLAFKGQGYVGDAQMKAGNLSPRAVEEIMAGARIATKLGIPYAIAEFEVAHDLGGKPGTTYPTPIRYIDELGRMPGVSDILLVPTETNYVGRGKARAGLGPRRLSAGPYPEGAGRIAAECMR